MSSQTVSDPDLDQVFQAALKQEKDRITVRPIKSSEKGRWEKLVEKRHYLKNAQMVGESICYVAECNGKWIALLGWSSCAFHLRPRDRWIGWSEDQRRARRHLVVCNARFLLLEPKGKRPNAASQILAANLRRLSEDWQAVYGHPVLLAETFVDPRYFQGTCYRASNWVEIGVTRGWGRSRLDFYQQHKHPKAIFLHPLYPEACEDLQADCMPPHLAHFERVPSKPLYPFKGGQARSLINALQKVPDPRKRNRCLHRSVASILTIAVGAMLSGVNTLNGIGQFSQSLNQNQLRSLRARKDRRSRRYIAPSEPTIRRLLQAVDPQKLDQVVCSWLEECEGDSDAPVLAIDGKCLRSASKAADQPIHLFSALSHRSALTRGQIKIADKTNEIPELKRLLEPLDLKGALVTADALHTQKETARHLVEDKEADYLLCVKGNQPALLDALWESVAERDLDDSFFFRPVTSSWIRDTDGTTPGNSSSSNSAQTT